MNKNLIKFLIQLKNASYARKQSVELEHINALTNYLSVLYNEGYIQSFSVKTADFSKKKISVNLRHYQNKVLTENIKFLSTPSRIKFLSYKDLTKTSFKNKLMILSTSRGVLSHKECLKHKIGGIAMLVC